MKFTSFCICVVHACMFSHACREGHTDFFSDTCGCQWVTWSSSVVYSFLQWMIQDFYTSQTCLCLWLSHICKSKQGHHRTCQHWVLSTSITFKRRSIIFQEMSFFSSCLVGRNFWTFYLKCEEDCIYSLFVIKENLTIFIYLCLKDCLE